MQGFAVSLSPKECCAALPSSRHLRRPQNRLQRSQKDERRSGDLPFGAQSLSPSPRAPSSFPPCPHSSESWRDRLACRSNFAVLTSSHGLARLRRNNRASTTQAAAINPSRSTFLVAPSSSPVPPSAGVPSGVFVHSVEMGSGSARSRSDMRCQQGQVAEGEVAPERKVILFDVMDTLVADPFHWHIPNFFGLSMKELLEQKHPTAWVDFEKGQLTEDQLHDMFFNDGRAFDLQGLKKSMQDAYMWVEGMEGLLHRLNGANVEMHAFTNYPSWYQLIEEKLGLSRYLPWTFVSCHTGMRKPEVEAYKYAAEHLGVKPDQCIFVDDRKANVAAAEAAGMHGLHFTSAASLAKDLEKLIPTFPLERTPANS